MDHCRAALTKVNIARAKKNVRFQKRRVLMPTSFHGQQTDSKNQTPAEKHASFTKKVKDAPPENSHTPQRVAHPPGNDEEEVCGAEKERYSRPQSCLEHLTWNLRTKSCWRVPFGFEASNR
jgi:hypothetical protein